MNRIILLTFTLFLSHLAHCQIGVNTESPHSTAALEINSPSQGVLLPRLTTLDKESIATPANGLLVYDTDKQCISQNIGTETNPQWICLTQNQTRFFYMPSINIPTPNLGVVPTPLDLYEEYKKQFNIPAGKNPAAPANIAYYTSADQLYYYVTYYDKNVMNITNISDDGKVSYSIIKKADYDTYMNVIFVIK